MQPDPTAIALLVLAIGAFFALPWRENDVLASIRALRSIASMLRPLSGSIRLLPEVDLLPAPLHAVRFAVPVRAARKMAV
jgi:hypothetical protein